MIKEVNLIIIAMDEEFEALLNNIKDYLEELDTAKLKSDAIVIGNKLKKEVNKLAGKVKEVSEPVVNKAIDDFRSNTVVLLKKTVEKLEN